jgi:hypothetical protein
MERYRGTILSARPYWRRLVRVAATKHYTDAHTEEYIQLVAMRLRLPYLIIEQITMQLNMRDRWNLFKSCDSAPLPFLYHERVPVTIWFTDYVKKIVRTAVEYMKPLLFGIIGVSNLYNTHTRWSLSIGSYCLAKKGVFVPLALRMTLVTFHALFLQYTWWPLWKKKTEMLARRLHTAAPRCRYCVYGNCSGI